MSVKEYANMKNQSHSENVTIHIIGPHRMQNELIAYFLGNVIGAECIVKRDIESSLSIDDKRSIGGTRVVLWDYDGGDIHQILIKLNSNKTESRSGVHLAIFNVSDSMGVEQKCLKIGVRGFFYKGDPMDKLISGVKHICNGGLWLSRDVMTKMILKYENRRSLSDTTNLTHRQIEILNLLANGASNKEISEKLCISVNTVRTHLYGIFQIIHVSSRHQAATWVTKNLPPSLIQMY
jgi:LuxR family transcriptional regulator, positive regulator of biofilm formation